MKWTPRLVTVAVLALSVALIASSAMAQPPGGGRGQRPGAGGPGGPGMMGGGGGGVMMLLMAEVVRTEVGVDDAMAEKVREVVRESMQPGRGERGPQDFRNLPDEEREKMRAERETRTKELEKKIAEVIGMEKFGRLKEIELQMSGVSAMIRAEVAGFLGLTDEQKEKIRELMEANSEKSGEQMRSIFSGNFREMSDADRTAAMEKMRTIRQESQQALEKDIMGVLTDEQKAKLAKMMGKPFTEMEKLREQMRAGFGPGGRGGEGRGPAAGGERGERGDGGQQRGQRGQRPRST